MSAAWRPVATLLSVRRIRSNDACVCHVSPFGRIHVHRPTTFAFTWRVGTADWASDSAGSGLTESFQSDAERLSLTPPSIMYDPDVLLPSMRNPALVARESSSATPPSCATDGSRSDHRANTRYAPSRVVPPYRMPACRPSNV